MKPSKLASASAALKGQKVEMDPRIGGALPGWQRTQALLNAGHPLKVHEKGLNEEKCAHFTASVRSAPLGRQETREALRSLQQQTAILLAPQASCSLYAVQSIDWTTRFHRNPQNSTSVIDFMDRASMFQKTPSKNERWQSVRDIKYHHSAEKSNTPKNVRRSQ